MRMSCIYNSDKRRDQVTTGGVPSVPLRCLALCFILLAETSAVRAPIALHTTNASSARSLRSQFQDQEQVFTRVFQVLEDSIAQKAFPGASVAITHSGKLVALKALGRFTYEPESPAVTTESIFDLASVSKVVATTTLAMILYDRGLLDLDAPVAGIVPELAGEDKRRNEVSLRMLLAHSSGLPAYEKLYLRAVTREELLRLAFAVPLRYVS